MIRRVASLEELPARIEALEAKRRQLSGTVVGAEFYRESATTIAAVLASLEEIERELTESYARWDALDSRTK